MKTFLFASVAAASLTLAGVAASQTLQTPIPTPPPVATPSITPDASVEGQLGTNVQGTPAQAEVQTDTDAAVTETQAEAEAEAQAQAGTSAQVSTEAEAALGATSSAEAAENAAATAASPAAPNTQSAAAPATTASATSVCQPRVTSVHFGARGSSLSQQNRNAIENAVDAASVCALDSVVIADSGQGAVSSRRTGAVRQALIRQGVPENRISVESNANVEGASTGALDVRMSFAGVARAGQPVASNEAEQPTPPPAS
ncbi:MAG: hypothetical protein U1E03_07140 [Hyphomonadaceae bacterium]